MTDLILTGAVALVAVLGGAVVGMAVIGLVGVMSGTRLIVDCPGCGRWQRSRSERVESVCWHCAHPRAFRWQPALLHRRGARASSR